MVSNPTISPIAYIDILPYAIKQINKDYLDGYGFGAIEIITVSVMQLRANPDVLSYEQLSSLRAVIVPAALFEQAGPQNLRDRIFNLIRDHRLPVYLYVRNMGLFRLDPRLEIITK